MPWDVSYYNTNPNANTTINGIDIAELCSPAGYNNALRQIMADIAVWTSSYAVSYPISIANGGTGATSAAAGLAALGGLGSAYQRLPQVAKSSSFTMDATMDGGHVRYTGAAATATVPPSVFTNGSVTLIVNDGSGALAIAKGSGVALIWASTGADAARSLAVGGMATLIQVSTNRFFISGTGLS